MPQIKVQNLYEVVVTEATGIPSSGDIDFTVSTPPEYTNGWLVVESENTPKRDLMYYHDVIGSRIYVRSENRPSPKTHTSGVSVKMLDVAEIFNFLSDMVSQLFYVEKTGGLTVKVWGGYTSYNGGTVTVADTNITLADNATNYIKYDYPTNTISSSTSNTGNIKVVVITSGGAITNISYRNAKESYIDFSVTISDALPSQVGNAGKLLGTNGSIISWQTVPQIRYISASINGTTSLTTADKVYFRIPSELNTLKLISVTGSVGTLAAGSSSSGIPTFTVKNVTSGLQMLSTSLTIDQGEYSSATAATPAVINTSNNTVATDNLIEVGCTTAGTGVTYAVVTLGFQ